jgi:hypothetical protein
LLFKRGVLQLGLTRLDCRLNLLLGDIDSLSSLRPLLGGQFTQLFELLGQQALLTKILDTYFVKNLQIAGGVYGLPGLLFECG